MASSRSEMEDRLQERLASDPSFREAFKADPRGAVEQTFGLGIPASVTIKVVENTPDTYYIVLPDASTGSEQALSDTDLEGVAGGIPHAAEAPPW